MNESVKLAETWASGPGRRVAFNDAPGDSKFTREGRPTIHHYDVARVRSTRVNISGKICVHPAPHPIEFSALNLAILSAAMMNSQIHGPRKVFQAVFGRVHMLLPWALYKLDSSVQAWLISAVYLVP